MTLFLSILTGLATSPVPYAISSIMFFSAFFKRHILDCYANHDKPKFDPLCGFLFAQAMASFFVCLSFAIGGIVAIVLMAICSFIEALSPILIFKHFDMVSKK